MGIFITMKSGETPSAILSRTPARSVRVRFLELVADRIAPDRDCVQRLTGAERLAPPDREGDMPSMIDAFDEVIPMRWHPCGRATGLICPEFGSRNRLTLCA